MTNHYTVFAVISKDPVMFKWIGDVQWLLTPLEYNIVIF